MQGAGLRVVDLLRHQVGLQPDKFALRIAGKARTYRLLAARVEQLTDHLGRTIGPGDRVGLWFHNCASWVESFLALNALGAVSVPINTRLTGAELKVIFHAAQLHALITVDRYRGRRYTQEACEVLEGAGGHVQIHQADDELAPQEWPMVSLGPPDERFPRAMPADVFCIQYTSGTTAVPKGVMLTDAAYLTTASYVARCQRLTPSSQFISAGPFFHCSGSMHALTVCLLAGCTLNSMSVWDPEVFLDEVAAQRCDVAHMVYFRDVLRLGAADARKKLATLQVAHDLGTPDYLMRIVEELGIPGVSNLYGMTETAGQYTMWFPDDPIAQRVAGSGRPQPGNHFRIVDPDSLGMVESGGIGEIQMRGSTLSRGYFQNAAAQAQAFTPDGWFRSGDLGRLGDHGELVYVARIKEMIRVGGENLAPAEVEQALRDLCGTSEVCVLAMPDERLDEVAAAVLVRPSVQDWPGLMVRLRERLAGFKVPRAIYMADQLPMTATNRVQRATLKAWIQEGRLERVV